MGSSPEKSKRTPSTAESSQAFRMMSEQIIGGTKRALEMTSFRFESLPVSKRSKQAFWSTWRSGRRYCPNCLSRDKSPYFRLIWRVNLIPICLEHEVFLKSRCGRCETPVQLLRLTQDHSVDQCQNCSFDLSRGHADAVEPSEEGMIATHALERVLNEKDVPAEVKWPYTPTDLFKTLGFVLRLLKLKERRESSSKGHFERRKGFGEVLRNEHELYNLMGRAWPMLQDYPSNLEYFLLENRYSIGRIQWYSCPVPIRDLHKAHHPRRVH